MIFLYAHSGLRYLILLVGLAVFLYALWGAFTHRPYDRWMKRLGSGFAGLMHLQILLGVGVLFSGRFTPAVTGHILLMVMAAAVAQIVPSVMRRRPIAQRTYLPHAVSAAVALALVAIGILAIGRSVLGSSLY